MNNHNQLSQKNAGLLGAICGSLLIGIPLSSLPGIAKPLTQISQSPCICQQAPVTPVGTPPASTGVPTTQYPSAVNPRPSIFNEPPYNRAATNNSSGLPGANLTPNRIVPADAPTTPAQVVPTPTRPGIAIEGATPGVTNPPGTALTYPVKPPLPENRSEPVATLTTANQPIEVRLKNNTNTVVTYESPGHTGPKLLAGGQVAVLPSLSLPATIAIYRGDDGFLELIPVTTNEPGVLEVTIDEDATPLDSNQGVLRIQRDGQVFLN